MVSSTTKCFSKLPSSILLAKNDPYEKCVNILLTMKGSFQRGSLGWATEFVLNEIRPFDLLARIKNIFIGGPDLIRL